MLCTFFFVKIVEGWVFVKKAIEFMQQLRRTEHHSSFKTNIKKSLFLTPWLGLSCNLK